MEILEKKIFYVNSRNRINSSDTDSNFSVKLDLPPGHDFNRVCLLDISIPKSYYLVQEDSTFILQELGVNTTITVSPGNYNRRNFATTITSLLNLASPNLWTYSITYTTGPDTGKYVYSVSGNSSNQPKLIFNSDNNLFEQFGFADGSTNTFSANSITSTNVVKFSIEDVLYLHCDMVSNGNDNVLKEIYTNGNSDYSAINQSTSDIFAFSKELTLKNNNSYRFYLTDEDDNIINLNGLNINMTLMIYKENSLSQTVLNLIRQLTQK